MNKFESENVEIKIYKAFIKILRIKFWRDSLSEFPLLNGDYVNYRCENENNLLFG